MIYGPLTIYVFDRSVGNFVKKNKTKQPPPVFEHSQLQIKLFICIVLVWKPDENKRTTSSLDSLNLARVQEKLAVFLLSLHSYSGVKRVGFQSWFALGTTDRTIVE